MPQVKARTFAGAVCLQDVWQTKRAAVSKNSGPKKPRFETPAERAEYNRLRSRRHHALVINCNYTPDSLYSTLTFDDDNEIHDFRSAERIADNFFRTLKYRFPNAKISIYIGRGKNTNRIHFHMLTDGITADYIREKWKYGQIVRIENLRENNYYEGRNIGRDYTGLADYLFDHWTEENGKGKRYKQTKNHIQPIREKPTICKRSYSPERPPLAPEGYKYIGCISNKYGFMTFKYVRAVPGKGLPMRN